MGKAPWVFGLVLILTAVVLAGSGCSGGGDPGGEEPGGEEPALELTGEGFWWLIPVDVQETVETTVIVASVGGFAAREVALGIEGLPPGVRAEFNPPVISVPSGGRSESTLVVHGSEEGFDEDTENKFPLEIRATGGGVTVIHEADLMLLCH